MLSSAGLFFFFFNQQGGEIEREKTRSRLENNDGILTWMLNECRTIVYVFPENKTDDENNLKKKGKTLWKISFILSSRLVGWDFNVVQLLLSVCQFVSETKRKLKAKTSIQSEKINKEGGAGHARMREIKRDDDGTTMKLFGGWWASASAIGSCVLYTQTAR